MSDLLEHRHRRRAPVFALALIVAAVVFAAIATSSARAAPITVTNLPLAPVEGQAYTGPVATFTDPGSHTASSFVATIEWGDGLTQTATITGAEEEFTVLTEGHTYAEEGANTLTVIVQEKVGVVVIEEGSRATTLAVADAPLLTALFSTPTTFTHAGPGTSATLSAFEAGIGGADNGAKAGIQPGGFRHINWDGVALDGSQPETIAISPGHTVAIPVGSQQDHGVALDSPSAVSNDGFASVNPGVTGVFGSLSAPNILAPFNTNALTLHIVAPTPPGSTPLPAATSGFGVTFLNVVLSNITSVEYFNGAMLLAKVFAPAGGHNQPSFVGALFSTPAITSVVINLGTARIFSFNGTTFSAGPFSDSPPNNLVAADDLLLAEPVPGQLTLSATTGVALSGVLGTFQDANPNANSHDSLATVDWGDGSSSQGVIHADASGGFSVSGTHTYAQAGTLPVSVAVRDLGGAHATLHATVVVSNPVAAPPSSSLTTPAPIPTPTPPPHCSLATTAGSAKLARQLGAVVARAHGKGHAHRSPNRLRAVATCNQNATVKLSATATLASTGKRGHTATAAAGSNRSVLQTLALGSASASLAADHPATLTIALSASTLARLTTAARRHKRISVMFTLAAANAHGTGSASAAVGSLKL
jgi:hypothetical protein